ncbi:MAG: HD domain-containing protein [Lachnospiraceae bacterium]|nr:HD domain-containing protein [Lachnospiraceae bacterium]
MWNERRIIERLDEILKDARIKKMDEFIQHGRTTTLEHSISVARFACFLNAKTGMRVDEEELFLAAMLHDYFLYDWHTKGDKLHGYHHPYIAAENAAKDFGVSEFVQSMIRTHMWPLNLRDIPRSRGAWILTFSDKVISAQETMNGLFGPKVEIAD